jgi:integrase
VSGAAKGRKRRSPGDGGIVAYETRAGTRYRISAVVTLPDGSTKRVFLRKGPTGERWTTPDEARAALRAMLADSARGEFIEPSRQALGKYGVEVIEGLRIGPQTRASYLKNWRLHVEPYALASLPLAQVTGTHLTNHYRMLEKSGRKDHKVGEGLSPRTVRYLHTIISRVLRQAVRDGLLPRNAADAATPPTAREAKAPEVTCWSAAQLAAFLRWAGGNSQHAALWQLLAMTGMRRGEALALRWREVDSDAGTISVRRSAGMVRVAGEGADVIEGDTKSGKARVVDMDAATAAVLKAHRRERGAMALQLARDDALVFGDIEGNHRNPEHTSRQFVADVARCRKAVGTDTLPVIRLHDLRHTHATILLTAREPVHVVSQRLGHASAVVTMTVYAHVLPGSQREAADLFARLVEEAGA